MKMNQDGQITIPKPLRDLLGLEPGDLLEAELNKDGILIKPRQTHREKVTQWLKSEHGDEMATLTTDQLMHLIQ
jgi:AbrB family looped-hinge helix DNA binding protein